MNNIPPLDARTVEAIAEMVPERCPDPRDTEREIWMKAGERRLVLRLLAIVMKQQESSPYNV